MISWAIHNRLDDCVNTAEDGAVMAPAWFFPKEYSSFQGSEWVMVTTFGDNVDCHQNWEIPEDAVVFRIKRTSDLGDTVTVYTGDIQHHSGNKESDPVVPDSLEKFVENLTCGSNDKTYTLEISTGACKK